MAYTSILERERVLREARELLSCVEASVVGMSELNKKKLDEVTTNTLAKLKKLPSVYYRSMPQLKLTHFLLTGLVCRNGASGIWKRDQLDKLKRIVL